MALIDQYKETLSLADRFKGMMGKFSIEALQSFSNFLRNQGVVRDTVEFGVYRGKSNFGTVHNFSDEPSHLVSGFHDGRETMAG